MKRAILHLVWILTLILLLAFIFPFGIRTLDNTSQDLIGQHYYLFRESGKMAAEREDSLAKRLTDFVAGHIMPPPAAESVSDTGWYHVYKNGIGSCDQMALILIRLARAYGIEGRVVFLYGADSVSGHSIAELRVNGQWAMFDPFYGVSFRTPAGNIPGVEELVRQPGLQQYYFCEPVPGHPPPDKENYLKFFEARYPFRVFAENTLSPAQNFWYGSLRLNSRIWGNFFDKIWERYSGL